MEFRRKTRILGAAVALAISAPVFASEKVQIKGSTSIELPKPSHVLEDSRNSRMHDGPSGRTDLGGGPPPVSPFLNTNPQADKRFREMLDKKKNWIFVNPYEMQYDAKTEQFMKGEKSTGLYSHRLMQAEEKGIVEQFLAEKNNQREPESDRLGSNPDERRGPEKDDFRGNARGPAELAPGEQKLGGNPDRGLNLPPVLDENSPFEKNPYERRLERSPLSDGILGGSDRLERNTIYTPEERAARDAELSKIYQPRVPGIATTIGKDPLNSAFDPTRQEMTPFSTRRNDPLNSGRATFGAPATRNSPIFAGPPVGAGSSSPGGGLPERSSFDINARSAQSSSFSPSVSTAPARSSSATVNPIPFQLPRPVRKF